jgi:hypothetical protein
MSWHTPIAPLAGQLITDVFWSQQITENLAILKLSINDDGTISQPPLHKGSGTSTAAGTTILDLFGVSGLTVDDQLLVHVTVSVVVNFCGRVDLYSSTDNQVLAPLSGGGNINAGVTMVTSTLLMNDQSATSIYNSVVNGFTTGGSVGAASAVTGLTAWTGNWNFSLRHNGVGAGGTMRYRWVVHKFKGQS